MCLSNRPHSSIVPSSSAIPAPSPSLPPSLPLSFAHLPVVPPPPFFPPCISSTRPPVMVPSLAMTEPVMVTALT